MTSDTRLYNARDDSLPLLSLHGALFNHNDNAKIGRRNRFSGGKACGSNPDKDSTAVTSDGVPGAH